MDGRTDRRTDNAKTISLRLRRGITNIAVLLSFFNTLPAYKCLKDSLVQTMYFMEGYSGSW